MSNDLKHQRRRPVLSCTECRRKKQRCDRKLPCEECITRGIESLCKYERFGRRTSGNAVTPSTDQQKSAQPNRGPSKPTDQSYHPYSNEDGALTSMGLHEKVVLGTDESLYASPLALQGQDRRSQLYFGYVRRIPTNIQCELVFQSFFTGFNNLHLPVEECIFREQLQHWQTQAHRALPKEGPDGISEELRCFPAALFQVLALGVQFLPTTYDVQLDELRYGLQTFSELSREYSDCGSAIAKLISSSSVTILDVQHSLLRDLWLCHAGDLTQAWEHSGATVKLAKALKLHIEPSIPSTSRPEELLNSIWTNEQRKRLWLNLFNWDNSMAVVFGRPMFINSDEVSVTPPLDCFLPHDRLQRIPVARNDTDPPTPITERLLNYRMALRFRDIKELECQGTIPNDPEKVKELHRFAIEFEKHLPPFFRRSDPDTTWDNERPFIPIQREMLVYLVEAFLVALHRPYVFTRKESQRQVFKSALAILDSQDRLEQVLFREGQIRLDITVVFPTFDAALILAVVLVLNPERYHAHFHRAYASLQRALKRLRDLGPAMRLAKSGAEVLQNSIRRVLEAQESCRLSMNEELSENFQIASADTQGSGSHLASGSSRTSPGEEPWQFEVDQTALDWSKQNFGSLDFDFSNLDVPMPLRELVCDDGLAASHAENVFGSAGWLPSLQAHGESTKHYDQEPMIEATENPLWLFLTEDPNTLPF